MIAIHERYQNQIDHMGWGRLISIEHHNQAFDGVPGVVDKIEKSGLCAVEVYIRGNEINKPVKVYDGTKEDKRFPTARIALEEYRKLEAPKTEITAPKRIETLKEQFKNRNANEKEMKQLEQLESYIKKETIKE